MSALTVAGLRESGGFVSAPTLKPITWKQDDQEFSGDIWVIHEESFDSTMRFFDDRDKTELRSAFVAAFVRLGEKGDERLTAEMVSAMNRSLAGAMAAAVHEVHADAKKSRPSTNSGTSSSLPASAAEASPKQNSD